MALGLYKEPLLSGNLDAKRDWGHAKDYVEDMGRTMQQNEPQDFVLVIGITTTIRDFIIMAFNEIGIELYFLGEGIDEKVFVKKFINPIYIL